MDKEALRGAFRGPVRKLEEVVAAGGDINRPVFTKEWPRGILLLEAAFRQSNNTAFEWLVRHGALPDLVKIQGNSLLIVAIDRQLPEICRFLLAYRKTSLESMTDDCGGSLLEVAELGTANSTGREIEAMVKQTLSKIKPEPLNDRLETKKINCEKTVDHLSFRQINQTKTSFKGQASASIGAKETRG